MDPREGLTVSLPTSEVYHMKSYVINSFFFDNNWPRKVIGAHQPLICIPNYSFINSCAEIYSSLRLMLHVQIYIYAKSVSNISSIASSVGWMSVWTVSGSLLVKTAKSFYIIMDFASIKRLLVFLGSRKVTLFSLVIILLLLTAYVGLPLTVREHLPFNSKNKPSHPDDVRSRRGRFDDQPTTKLDPKFDDQHDQTASDTDTYSSSSDAWLQSEETGNAAVADDEHDEFMTQQAEIQRQRKRTLRETCNRYNITSRIKHDHYFVDDKYDLVYCYIPKVASTNWKLVFQKLAGVVGEHDNVSQFKINRDLKKELVKLTDTHQMESSLTFMFARNPFSRILSVYRNKLEPNTTFERAHGWQEDLGRRIIKTYRDKEERHEKYDLTFSEFVHYISDRSNKGKPGWQNIHWNEYYKWCSPCDVKYDVIGKLETLHDDAKYIFKLAKIRDIEFEDPSGSSPTFSYQNDTLNRYFEDVPMGSIYDLYNRYQFDFELFGYDLPKSAEAKLYAG
ncbi:carbohydrate sulfotransferase 10-like [Amphiura filiformis]|uniref:carbohydrate sulfotransferase 10-like n=1 Tax=Amphiura filiformis TaxID=82378 RepID=UPI003B21987E